MVERKNDMNTTHFDEWAPGYETSAVQKLFFDPIHRKMISLLTRSAIGSPSTILDVGCGTGRLLRAISKIWPDAQLTGVDLSEPMITIARKLAPLYRFHISPAEKLPLQDQSYDLVVSSLTLHHWNDAAMGIKEIVRVLKPGGVFCIADHLGPKWAMRFFESGAKSNHELDAIFKNNGLETVARSWFWGWVGIRLAKQLTQG